MYLNTKTKPLIGHYTHYTHYTSMAHTFTHTFKIHSKYPRGNKYWPKNMELIQQSWTMQERKKLIELGPQPLSTLFLCPVRYSNVFAGIMWPTSSQCREATQALQAVLEVSLGTRSTWQRRSCLLASGPIVVDRLGEWSSSDNINKTATRWSDVQCFRWAFSLVMYEGIIIVVILSSSGLMGYRPDGKRYQVSCADREGTPGPCNTWSM